MELNNKSISNDYKIVNYLSNFSADFYLAVITIISTIGVFIPYNRIIKLGYAIIMLVLLFFIVLKRTELFLPSLFILSASPVSNYKGLVSSQITFITMDNKDILVIGLLFILFVKLLIDKKIKIKGMLPIYLLLFIMSLSYFYTDTYTRNQYYTFAFWYIVLLYLAVIIFINNDKDFMMILKGMS